MDTYSIPHILNELILRMLVTSSTLPSSQGKKNGSVGLRMTGLSFFFFPLRFVNNINLNVTF